MAGEVECHPSRQYSSFQIGLSGNQGICCSSVHQIHNDSTFAFCRHDIKLLKSDLDITHPDAMIRAANDSLLPSKPFSAWCVSIPDFPSWRNLAKNIHTLLSFHPFAFNI